jgi:hypothetical protein
MVDSLTRGWQRERFVFPRGLSFSCNEIEDLHGLCLIQRKNKIKPTLYQALALSHLTSFLLESVFTSSQ